MVLRLFWRHWPAEGWVPHLPWKDDKTAQGTRIHSLPQLPPCCFPCNPSKISWGAAAQDAPFSKERIWDEKLMETLSIAGNDSIFPCTFTLFFHGCDVVQDLAGSGRWHVRVHGCSSCLPGAVVGRGSVGSGSVANATQLWRRIHFPRHHASGHPHPAALANRQPPPSQPRP